ncbi:DNA-binding response regulator [Thalassotalea insulae]|uniref:DNA-binding response regulator n=1 Tax=Thalassotalea insulae TaxID=2056778 RepID=A0ABQ6GVT2_9GAMM|nr:response regulator transcription factor [Thalassotalea insulae]GLX80028.1 DNA-binding response regulator [Thalassotalea insulae]
MRILIVEDDKSLQTQLKQQLELANYSVDTADDGEIGLYQGTEYQYDAAVIDLGLPKLDGKDLIQTLRKQGIDFPIIVLTARDRWQDKVEGLDAGADDYLTKPFHHQELQARLNALIRRSVGQASPIMVNGPFELDTASMQVRVNQQAVNLSSYEYKVFEYLMLHQGQVKSKTELTEHIYDQDFDLDSNVIEVFIRRLRKKLDPDGQYQFIETLRGQGYKLRQFAEAEK